MVNTSGLHKPEDNTNMRHKSNPETQSYTTLCSIRSLIANTSISTQYGITISANHYTASYGPGKILLHLAFTHKHFLKSFVDSSPAVKDRKCFCTHYPHYCLPFLFKVEMSIFALARFDLMAHGLVVVVSCFATITKGNL